MLKIQVAGGEYYDELKERFIKVDPQPLQLEHSLVSISRWESKWNRSFINDGPKTEDEKIGYIQDMTITQNVDPMVYKVLTPKQRHQIDIYCSLPMTATTIGKDQTRKPGKKTIITAEIIYYWMISFGIPFECEKWHLNRLLMLIQVCSIKNNPPKKLSPREAAERTRAINAQRRRPKKGR